MGLENIKGFSKGDGDELTIQPWDGDCIVLKCGHARDAWLKAFEDAIKRFRSMFVVDATTSVPTKSKTEKIDKWDTAVEEKLRREVEDKSNAVRKAKSHHTEANKILNELRLEHQRPDQELTRYRNKSADLDNKNEVAGVSRRCVRFSAGAGPISKQIEDAVSDYLEDSEKVQKHNMKTLEIAWQRKVRQTEER